jgi:transcriptional regulator GlxA family with amidase domain
MQSWSKNSEALQHYGVLLFDGFSNHCLANAVEPLRAANMLSGKPLYLWEFITQSGQPATSSSGMQVNAHKKLSDATGDMLIVMPSYGFRNHSGWATNTALRTAAKRFATLAGLDTGSWLLAEAGLLSGHRATIHWEELASFAEKFSDIDVRRERFVIDANRITCSGAMAAFDMVMVLIGRDHGQALALEVAQLFMSHDAVAIEPLLRGRSRTLINRAIAVMQEHIEHPLPITRIAKRSGCTQKTLESRMKVALGASPQQIYRRMRLIAARKMILETNMTVSEVSLRCGYLDSSAMTRAFRAEFGTTPRALRSRIA